MHEAERWPDALSDWAFPPPTARQVGEVELLRVFDTAEAALACLRRLGPAAVSKAPAGVGASRSRPGLAALSLPYTARPRQRR